MAGKRAAGKQAASGAAATGTKGSAVRVLGPAIPLAVALIGGALSGGPGATTPQTAGAPVTTVSSSNWPVLAACGGDSTPVCDAPYPMAAKGHPVEWWFVFKLNAAKFPLCGASVTSGGVDARKCPFGGTPMTAKYPFGQQYVMASSEAPALAAGGSECVGDTSGDPVGATFDEVYNGGFNFVVWNDQFYGDPKSASCSGDGCDSPWGHSKGMLAWNDAGEGLVMQVSTPSWPGSGNRSHPRATDGNTLGCTKDDDVKVSQHFFSLRLTEPDVVEVLKGLNNASVVTDKENPQIVHTGGPKEITDLVSTLGVKSKQATVVTGALSSGVRLISKPSALHVPPWQMVSSVLGGIPLRAATWWATPEIYSTTDDMDVSCWDATALPTKPGAVEIATSGSWQGHVFSLAGSPASDGNHAKIGVSTTANDHLAIFGDENQQGTISAQTSPKPVACDSSQNGRGGMFFVVQDTALSASLGQLIAGGTAGTGPAPSKPD